MLTDAAPADRLVMPCSDSHGAVLHGQAVPVQHLMGLNAATPTPRRPAGLQGFVCGGGVSTRPPPAQKHTAAAVAAQHQLDARHLHQRTRVDHGSSLTQRHQNTSSPYLDLLTNIFSFCHKAEVVAAGFSRQQSQILA